MQIKEQEKDLENLITLEKRREFLKLSVEKRREILSKQANEIISHYKNEDEQKQREDWQGGDIVEY
jgi:hypothetical protein